MAESKDKILVINRDEDERAVMAEAALEPFGYEVQGTGDGNQGLSMILDDKPDAILLDLEPEGLSGADIMAALNAQAIDAPVVVLADKGKESEALHAFRLGAKDYIVRPIREAELIQVVERALKDVRLQRERETLISEVRRSAQESEQRLREIKTLMGIGKSVASLTNINQVFEHLIRAAIQLTNAESVGIFLKDEQSGQLILRAGRNLSRNLVDLMGQPVVDELASMVMNSRETLLSDGDGLKRLKPAQADAQAVIYAPLVVTDSPIGLLWVANSRMSFESRMIDLMTALADYAAIALVNARLFVTMQERTKMLEEANRKLQKQMGETPAGVGPADSIPELAGELRAPLTDILGNMNLFRGGEMGKLTHAQQASADVLHRKLEALVNRLDELVPPSLPE